jgi:ADP-ribose pyrophosphatase YjhB (NUDIX family)
MQQDERTYILNSLFTYGKMIESNFFSSLSPETTSFQLKYIERSRFFIETEPKCFYRESLEGHITGSAFILNHNLSKVLLNHHLKLNKWLQLGGHADGDWNISQVALREAQEESSLKDLSFFDLFHFPRKIEMQQAIPFDIDLHLIPERAKEPQHYHYDFRYLLYAQDEDFSVSHESIDLKWVPLQDVFLYTDDPSTLRPIQKIKTLLENPEFR